MSYCNLILDALLAVILVHGLISGWLRGFVRVVFRKLRWLTSLICALLVARPIGGWLGEEYFMKPMVGEIRGMLVKALGTGANDATAAELASELPIAMRGLLGLFGVDVSKYAADIDAAGGNALTRFADSIAAPVANIIGVLLTFVVAYFVFRLFLRVIVYVINAIFCLPGLRFINKILGVVAGVAFAAVFGWILMTLCGYIFGLLADSGVAFFADFDMQTTWIAKYFYQSKPLEFIFSI
jgi:uncharacterized membrane protein required for colicin V production